MGNRSHKLGSWQVGESQKVRRDIIIIIVFLIFIIIIIIVIVINIIVFLIIIINFLIFIIIIVIVNIFSSSSSSCSSSSLSLSSSSTSSHHHHHCLPPHILHHHHHHHHLLHHHHHPLIKRCHLHLIKFHLRLDVELRSSPQKQFLPLKPSWSFMVSSTCYFYRTLWTLWSTGSSSLSGLWFFGREPSGDPWRTLLEELCRRTVEVSTASESISRTWSCRRWFHEDKDLGCYGRFAAFDLF